MDDGRTVDGWESDGLMGGVDAIMWRMSADPRARVECVWIGLLDSAPEWRRFVECCEWATDELPRLKQRVVEPLMGLGPPGYADCPHFRLSDHVSENILPGPGDLRQVLDIAERWSALDFDRSRPPWGVLLLRGFDASRAAVVVKWHHALADGHGFLQTLQFLLGASPRPTATKGDRGPVPHVKGSGWRREQIALSVGALPRGVAQVLRTTSAEVRQASQHPWSRTRQAFKLVQTAEQAIPRARPSRLFGQRSLARRFEVIDLRMPSLKKAAKHVDATVTSAFAAAVLGAGHDYHRHRGVGTKAVPIAVPVSVRKPGRHVGGNEVSALLLAWRLSDMNAADRVRAVHSELARVRARSVNGLFPALAELGAWVPAPLIRSTAPLLCRSIDLWVSSMVGLTPPVHLAGAEVTDSFILGPRASSACLAALTSHGDKGYLTLNLDPAAISDPDLFCALVRRHLQEIIGIAASAS
ncbi:wax ester/triacylglycerol synthase domain-containing protein [Actinomadura macrotermitis]|uniref:diacylglycerol O-acyltransferase n=1 Tax=Actinomadura macrotermitis TaxID=2585200 RepID=A0A7K0C321_9ACTN|nr:wax ester/triacylglycerol synthase domain-containing protein [Actinomadura macrotermitis]MQY07849.1 putative diacylglycerol O-acyltransferase [Actinomadura macrotermitis]